MKKNEGIYYLDDISLTPKFRFPETIGVRTEGLLGDNIIASTAFRGLINAHKKPIVIFSTYTHDKERVGLLSDLYSELISKNVIKGIIHFSRPHGPITDEQRNYLLRMGCQKVYDCGPFESEFRGLQRGEPFLGEELGKEWKSQKRKNNTIGLFRWSGFHTHYFLRNRPYEEWEIIEKFLVEKGFECILFGYDDLLPNKNGFADYRKKLTVYETLKKMAQCSLLISTSSFPPLFCQYYIPCLVLSDPRDIENLKEKWEVSSNYKILDVTKNYINQIRTELDNFYKK
ncbi:MAG: hypothetical protein V1696_01780 [Candidatus Jorgensenbacteria bacterium]